MSPEGFAGTGADSGAARGARELAERVRAQLAPRLVGYDEEITLLLCAVLAGKHVLVEGVPGIGKTLLASSLASALGVDCKRIQFTPDLLPADILGGFVYDQRAGSFELRKGPIFTHVVVADEINRAPAKTQSALLEVMQERQVTIEGETLALAPPFFVFATQNPVEHEGVYPLPQAQLDRFALRLQLGYPSADVAGAILRLHRDGAPPPAPGLPVDNLLAAQAALADVNASDEILDLLVQLAERIRDTEGVQLGASPRLGIDVLSLARARALLDGRAQVIPDDLKALYLHAANHRVQLDPGAEVRGLTPHQVVHDALLATKLV
ncbi:MAG: putative methanol dehydrogenase transcriptional regulatory protein MoxR3 [Planctomycetota bacterium]|nr:MAG: putative methanol dehydrogenase transcriptional regulatory protein MoxR3 [Planctomycetota bacterium]